MPAGGWLCALLLAAPPAADEAAADNLLAGGREVGRAAAADVGADTALSSVFLIS